MTAIVAGVDACRIGKQSGWVAVVLADSQVKEVMFAESFEDLCSRLSECEVIAVDIPIGFPSGSPHRRCDEEAREAVGDRRASVFYAPPREVFEAKDHSAASKLNKELTGKGLSIQAWSLKEKALEVNRALEGDKALKRRVSEVHPEVSFTKMAEGTRTLSLGSKKSWVGQERRRKLLERGGVPIALKQSHLKGEAERVPTDDLYDAAAAAWTALRIHRGEARSLPESPGPDEPTIRY